MATNDNTISQGVVHSGDLPGKPAPVATEGAVAWMRDNLFNGLFNSALSLLALALLLYILPGALSWLIFNANWVGGVVACQVNPDGACWPSSACSDTTLVLIISLFDLLGVVQASIADPNWSVRSVPYTGYVFVAIVFWVCCYSMARYSRYIENKLHTGHKR